jgi:hypothetical protein
MWWREVVMPATFKSKLGDDTLKLRSAGYSRTSASDGVGGLHVIRSCLAVAPTMGVRILVDVMKVGSVMPQNCDQSLLSLFHHNCIGMLSIPTVE